MDRGTNMNKNTLAAGVGLPPIPSRPRKALAGDQADNQPTIGIQALALEGQSQGSAKKLKRVLASRRYSQKYREKINNRMMTLQTQVKALEAEVTIKTLRIKYSQCENSLVRDENSALKQKLSTCSEVLTSKKAEFEGLQKEKEALHQLYAAQTTVAAEYLIFYDV